MNKYRRVLAAIVVLAVVIVVAYLTLLESHVHPLSLQLEGK